VIPKNGYFGFDMGTKFLGWVDSAAHFWDDYPFEYIVFNDGVDEVYKLRLEDNAAMKANGASSAVNILFVFTSDLSKSYGEKRSIYDLTDSPAPTPTPTATPNLTAGADDWAVAELTKALAAGLVPDAVSAGGWTSPTTRLAAADAVAALVEKTSGKTIDALAKEKGWDLAKNGFSDTSAKSATFLKYAGISNGIGDNNYSPSGTYTRAQMVTMIGRAAEFLFGVSVKGANPFTDVPDWAAPYVGYAADKGITNGVGDNKFNPDGALQNQHTAVFALRAYEAWK
jgi:hypothetical protein